MILMAFYKPVMANDRLYQVEVIIFETGALRGWTEEHWPLIETPLDISEGLLIKSLPKKNFMLNTEASKMTPKKGYRILLHKSMNLYAHSEKNAKLIQLENFPTSIYQTKLLGKMRFYKSRYAHVDFNLQIEKKIPKKVKEAFATQQKLQLDTLPDDWRFELHESRKIRPSELHYIDHPLFGAIVKIKPLD